MIVYTYEATKDLNPFAPNFSFKMGEDIIPTNLNLLKSFFITKEKQLINKYEANSDGGTQLSKNSITTRFVHYNLLAFPEINFLKDIIKNKYEEFIKRTNVHINKSVYIQCWYNVMRKGEQIKKHNHSRLNSKDVFLSGNLCVNVDNTSTYYSPPLFEKVIEIKNKNNQIVFFPSWLEHYTDSVKDNFERITIGFDLKHTEDPGKNGVWIKL
tara:strand:+ start:2613 stop:3248 length:636 start_codon:yes stop_codon:yes gene_type:complete